MKRGFATRMVALAAVGALALVGCNGDDDGDDGGSTPSPAETMTEQSPAESPTG